MRLTFCPFRLSRFLLCCFALCLLMLASGCTSASLPLHFTDTSKVSRISDSGFTMPLFGPDSQSPTYLGVSLDKNRAVAAQISWRLDF